jgi:hypothetical protein
MISNNPAARRRARFAARVGVIGSAVMLTVTAWSWLSPADAAPTNAGNATVVDPTNNQPKTSGGSSTDFTLKLPSSPTCTGDSPNAGYRVQSYMVPSSVDPTTLKFDNNGPTPQATKTNFREPLFDVNTIPYVNAQTAAATSPGGPGPIINIPTFNFKVYSPGDIPAGTYNVGIACTLGPPTSNTQLDKYWNVQMTFATSSADSPAQVTWTAQAPSGGTTTTTTGSGGSTTTTTAAGGTTTTTRAGSTTTTTASGGTTTTTAPGATTTTAFGTTTTTTASQATATLLDGAGNSIAANSSLTPGQQVTISATGFTSGETTTITVQSDPITLGSSVADSTGKVSKSVTIPTSLAAGSHTLTVTGTARTATFPFTIAASSSASGSSSSGGSTGSSSGSLPFTGSSPLSMVLWAALLLAFGRIAVLLGRPIVTRRGRDDR